MFQKVKSYVAKHKTILLVVLLVLLIGIAYAAGRNSTAKQTTAEKPAVMTQGEMQDVTALRNQLDISCASAQALCECANSRASHAGG